jgi:hypothetical protein
MTRHGSLTLFGLTLAAAGLLAANQQTRPEGWPVIGVYGYWLVRIGIESTLFIAFLQLLSLLPRIANHTLWAICLAALASYIPFVLSVTALDIVLGLPELDATTLGEAGSAIQLGAFLQELVYLLDNHIFLCAMLSIPMVLQACWIPAQLHPPIAKQSGPADMLTADRTGLAITSPDNAPTKTSFLESLSPPFADRILRAEAQEHYVKLVGPNDTQMVLYRFSDILRELPKKNGHAGSPEPLDRPRGHSAGPEGGQQHAACVERWNANPGKPTLCQHGKSLGKAKSGTTNSRCCSSNQ